jgi:NADH:ubiquinone oxidoreductase subunit 4 (subunit M)
LKLGGVGLYRLIPIIDMESMKLFFLSYFIIFTVFRTIVCCFQSDFKRLIAYSSVAHIIVVPFLVFSNNLLSIQSLIIVMLFHGLSSTLIFIRVGTLYLIYSSRQLVLIRGLVLISPLIRIFIVLTFFYTLSAPPFPSFIAEIYFMISSFILRSYIVYIFIPFILLGLVYNIN